MKKEELITVMVIRNGVAKIEKVENTLKTFQELVGGYIEIPFISSKLCEKGIDIIINEEGKLLNLKPSFVVMDGDKLIDVIHGNVIFTSRDSYGNQKSLTKDQFDYICKLLSKIAGLM